MPGWLFWGGVCVTPAAAYLGAMYGSWAGGLWGNVAANLVLLGPSLIITHVIVEQWRRKHMIEAIAGQLDGVAVALGAVLDTVMKDLRSVEPCPWPQLPGHVIRDGGLDIILQASVLDETSKELKGLAASEYGHTKLSQRPWSLTLARSVTRLQIAIAQVQLTNSAVVSIYIEDIIDGAEKWDSLRGQSLGGHDLLEQIIGLIDKLRQLRHLLIDGLPVNIQLLEGSRPRRG
jgi:hypothetical protein